MRRSPPSGHRLLATLALALAIVAFPLGALASHNFADVPDSNPFHADISALVAAGVTSGCGGGNYCPSANVTREQMAAFMNRLGALAPGKTPVVNATKLDGLDSTQLARTDQVQHFSCTGDNMWPESSSSTYATVGTHRYLTAGPDYVTCSINIPDGSTITGYAAYVVDEATPNMHCGIWGQGVMAETAASSGAPGFATLTDTTIANAVVDNGTFGYVAWCFMEADPDLGVQYIVVTYTGAP